MSLERSYKLAKKSSQFNKPIDKVFSDIIIKVKKGNLNKDEKVGPRLTEELKQELDSIQREDLNEWKEGWDPDCLAFRYFNVFQEYKIKYDAFIKLHLQLIDRKNALSEEEMYKFELNLGIDVKQIK